MISEAPILLILDLDETLIFATEEPLAQPADFAVGPYAVYRRPGLAGFLAACSADFRLGVWSSATDSYVEDVVARIMPPGLAPEFVWGRSRCVRRLDPEYVADEFLKDLKKVGRRGFDLRRVLIADDTPSKVRRHYGNAVSVPPFLGDCADDVLPRLAAYLHSLRDLPDVRPVEKRGWSSRGR